MGKRQRGFSVVQVVIVVAILLVIAAIAIPSLLHSKLSENESSAVSSLRTLNASCASYSILYGGYPRSLSNLGPGNPASSTSAGLIDSALASGAKGGYVFTYTAGATGVGGNVLSYSISANPITPGTTGQRRFFTDQSGVIRPVRRESPTPAARRSARANGLRGITIRGSWAPTLDHRQDLPDGHPADSPLFRNAFDTTA